MVTVDLPQPSIRKTNLWRHQLEAYHFAFDKQASLCAMAMGTGKSAVVISLLENWHARRVLIICPKSVLAVWRREFSKHSQRETEVLVLDAGGTNDKLTVAKRWPWTIVVNYDSVWRGELGKWIASQTWDTIVCDESHRIKSPTGRSSKFIGSLSGKRRICCTGTPAPHSPLDLFGQFRFLDQTVFGRWYTHFRSRYAVTSKMFPSQVIRWINQDELSEKYHKLAFTVGSEVLDLPEVMHETRSFVLSREARRIYDELKNELIAVLEADGGVITVDNALVKLLRLQQLTGGLCETDAGSQIVDTGKQEQLKELLECLDATEPVVVFCRFRHDLDSVADVAQALERPYGELSGRRNDLTDHAQYPEEVAVLGVQIQSGGVGIDLTRAAYAIYYSLGYSLGDYLQSAARVHRPGQTRPVRYYHIVAENTVDELVYKALEARQEVVEAVVKQMRESK